MIYCRGRDRAAGRVITGGVVSGRLRSAGYWFRRRAEVFHGPGDETLRGTVIAGSTAILSKRSYPASAISCEHRLGGADVRASQRLRSPLLRNSRSLNFW